MVWLVLFCFGMMFFMYAFSKGYRRAPTSDAWRFEAH